MCPYCHRSKVFTTMRAELEKRSREGQDLPHKLMRREAWMLERQAKKEPGNSKGLLELVEELRTLADTAERMGLTRADEDDPLGGAEPVPIVDRDWVERS